MHKLTYTRMDLCTQAFFFILSILSTDGKCLHCKSETAIVAQNPDHTNSWWNRPALVSKQEGRGWLCFII